MDYTEMLTDNRFSVIAALPRNDLALAEAALEGGAQAVKVHCNVWHRASGNTFGTFEENRTFLRELIALCGDVPVGLVPGGEDAYINEEERLELALPLEEGQPFPLEPLFCLGRLERVAGQLCVVYAFRGEEPGIW